METDVQKSSGFNFRYFLLYSPFLISVVLSGEPVISYFIAWIGSFVIFYLSFTNKIRPTHENSSIAEKIFRPVFLTQIIFAGYMSCSSVFNFLDLLGYEYFTKIPNKPIDINQIKIISACQQYYVLGHAAFVHGMLFFYKNNIRSKYAVHIPNWPAFFIKFGIIAAPLGVVCSKIGGLSVLGGAISGIAFVASTIGLALSIPLKKVGLTMVAGIIFGINMLAALTSGYKEPVIVSFLMLGLFLYPFYKKIVTTVFIPLILILFTVLPTYVNTFRAQNWGGDQDAETAKQEAIKKVREDLRGNGLAETNWAFLTGRITEIGMFAQYKESREQAGNFYGFQIVGQSLMALVPRILWKDKPIMEDVVNIRVIENGIIGDEVNVSAKPQYIVDAYLSFGISGIWIFLFLYGALAQAICNKAEELFGGYLFGIAFVYTGMMGSMWRGNCFEFIFNQIFYAFLTMIALFFLFKQLKIVIPKSSGFR